MNCKKCGCNNDKDSVYCKQCGHRLKAGKRGFASMSKEKRSEIAQRGGIIAHKIGHAHEFTKAEATAAGKIGGRNKKKLAVN